MSLRFVPSRVVGLSSVDEVAVFYDRLELCRAAHWEAYPFETMARWPRPRWLWRWLFRVGLRPRFLPVGERDWFHAPQDRFFVFFTKPRIVVYMPVDDSPAGYSDTIFRHVEQIIRAGGFSTWDLG